MKANDCLRQFPSRITAKLNYIEADKKITQTYHRNSTAMLVAFGGFFFSQTHVLVHRKGFDTVEVNLSAGFLD